MTREELQTLIVNTRLKYPVVDAVVLSHEIWAALSADKPTANEGLVGEIEAYCKEAEENGHYITEDDLRPILSKYRTAPSLPVEPLKGCNYCGSNLFWVRGKYPQDPCREVCPTFVVEKLEDMVLSINNTVAANSEDKSTPH